MCFRQGFAEDDDATDTLAAGFAEDDDATDTLAAAGFAEDDDATDARATQGRGALSPGTNPSGNNSFQNNSAAPVPGFLR